MIKKSTLTIIIIILIFCLIPDKIVFAQESPTYPAYIVQPGETLTEIAYKFNVSINELIKVNGIVNPDLISEGTQLYIPGLEGITGVLKTETVVLGESLNSFIKEYQVSKELILKLNRITSPEQIYAGSNLIIPVDNNNQVLVNKNSLLSGQSFLELAAVTKENPWSIIFENHITTRADLLPGDLIFALPGNSDREISPISPLIQWIKIEPLPLVQGHTTSIKFKSNSPITMHGYLGDHELHFYSSGDEEDVYYALQGIHAMANPGLTPLYLDAQFQNGEHFDFKQNLLLLSGGYIKDPPLLVSDETVDPKITKPENDEIKKLTAIITPEKYWTTNFRYPVDGSIEDGTIHLMSVFGSRRSYNNSEYIYFHTGVDFGVYINSLNIYAAAPGRVIFAGPLIVRGNATYIDHGQGILSGYFHQKEIFIKEGDFVEAGQLIGLIGNTGRVTGPHLHWEIWVNGVQVNPIDWVNNNYP